VSSRNLRVYLVGAHSTGKTTLSRWIRDAYGLPMLSEVARTVLAELEMDLDSLRANLDAVDRYQSEVFHRQVSLERGVGGGFVSDRAFCNLAYAAQHSTILARLVRGPEFESYMRWVSGGLVFFVRPHRELVCADGVRAGLDYEEILAIDGMVKLLLEMHAIPYVPIANLSMQERVRTIRALVDSRLREMQAIERAEALARGRRASGFEIATRDEAERRGAGTNGGATDGL
jgi:nicotinamide riboside kinase